MSREIEIKVGISPEKDLEEYSDWIGGFIADKDLQTLYRIIKKSGLVQADIEDIKFVVLNTERAYVGGAEFFKDGLLNADDIVIVSSDHKQQRISYTPSNNN